MCSILHQSRRDGYAKITANLGELKKQKRKKKNHLKKEKGDGTQMKRFVSPVCL